jgi:hypothetical protein
MSEWMSQSVSEEVVAKLVAGLLKFSRCELMLCEAGSWAGKS